MRINYYFTNSMFAFMVENVQRVDGGICDITRIFEGRTLLTAERKGVIVSDRILAEILHAKARRGGPATAQASIKRNECKVED
jgi:hypothetical protein